MVCRLLQDKGLRRPRTKDLGPRTKYHGLRTKDYGLSNFSNASRHSRRLRLGMNDPPKIRTKETKD